MIQENCAWIFDYQLNDATSNTFRSRCKIMFSFNLTSAEACNLIYQVSNKGICLYWEEKFHRLNLRFLYQWTKVKKHFYYNLLKEGRNNPFNYHSVFHFEIVLKKIFGTTSKNPKILLHGYSLIKSNNQLENNSNNFETQIKSLLHKAQHISSPVKS